MPPVPPRPLPIPPTFEADHAARRRQRARIPAQRPAPLRPHHRGAAGHRRSWRRCRWSAAVATTTTRPAAPTRPPRRPASCPRASSPGRWRRSRTSTSPSATRATPSRAGSRSRSSSAPSASPSSTATTAAPRRPGVTGDSIKVVAWLPNDDDPIFEPRAPGPRHRRVGRRGPRDLRGPRRDLPDLLRDLRPHGGPRVRAGVGLHARPGGGPGRRPAGCGDEAVRRPRRPAPRQHVDRGAARPGHHLHGLPGHVRPGPVVLRHPPQQRPDPHARRRLRRREARWASPPSSPATTCRTRSGCSACSTWRRPTPTRRAPTAWSRP